MRPTTKHTVFVAICCCLSTIQSRRAQPADVEVPLEQLPEVLTFLATSVASNIEKIRTWEGIYTVADTTREASLPPTFKNVPLDGPYMATRSVEVAFKIENEGGKSFNTYRFLGPMSYVHVPSKKTFRGTPEKLHEVRSVVTPEHYLSFDPHTLRGQIPNHEVVWLADPGTPVVYRRDPRDADKLRRSSSVINPMDLYGLFPFSFDERLASCARAAKEALTTGTHRPFPMSVWQRVEGDSTDFIFESRLRGTGMVTIMRTLHASQVGYNVVDYSLQDEGAPTTPREVIGWQYEPQGDIYVPTYYDRKLYDKNGVLQIHRVMRLTESKLNESFSEDAFGYAGLNIPDGARIMDEIEDAHYVYKAGNLIPAAEWDPVSALHTRDPFLDGKLLLACALAVLFVIALLLVKRLRAA
jgi:hypothetical protein